MSELDKLESYLKSNNYEYVRIDERRPVPRHQIIVYDDYGDRAWDAICHRGSYGYEDGLLEIMGSIVDVEKDGDSVAGWLTAEDVINRLAKEETDDDNC